MSLNQLLDQFMGGNNANMAAGNSNDTATQANSANSGPLSNFGKHIPGGLAGGLAAGGLLGVLVGNKKMRKSIGEYAGGVATIGGSAALGALAFKAYQGWQTSSSPGNGVNDDTVNAANPVPNSFDPTAMVSKDGHDFQLVLVKAMIAAANADGHIDGDERSAVFEAVNKMELGMEQRSLVLDTLQNPPTIEDLAKQANGIEQASEIYLASRLAIDPDHPTEQIYLQRLADQLSLPPDLIAHLEQQVEGPPSNATGYQATG